MIDCDRTVTATPRWVGRAGTYRPVGGGGGGYGGVGCYHAVTYALTSWRRIYAPLISTLGQIVNMFLPVTEVLQV